MRRSERVDLIGRLRESWDHRPPERRGVFLLGLLANAVVTVLLQILTVALLVRLMIRSRRSDVAGESVRVSWHALMALAGAHVVHQVLRRRLVARLGQDTTESEGGGWD